MIFFRVTDSRESRNFAISAANACGAATPLSVQRRARPSAEGKFGERRPVPPARRLPTYYVTDDLESPHPPFVAACLQITYHLLS